jgi:hypothetical protein
MVRWIIWKPVIIEVYDNRLTPKTGRDYPFEFRVPEKPEGWTLSARVRYHIMTDRQYRMLKDRYGLEAEVPYHFTVFERTIPLSGPLTALRPAPGSPAVPRPAGGNRAGTADAGCRPDAEGASAGSGRS